MLATGYAELPPGVTPDVVRLDKPFLLEQLLRAVADAAKAKRRRGAG